MEEEEQANVNRRFSAEDQRRREKWKRFLQALKSCIVNKVSEWKNRTTNFLKRPRRLWFWAKGNPMLALAFSIGPALAIIGIIAWCLGLICTWSDLGAFLQGAGWVIGPIGAAMALHYAGQRTTQMIRQTDTQMSTNGQKQFVDALNFIYSEQTHEQMAGLASLRNRTFALNESFFQSACMALEDFIKLRGPKPTYQVQIKETDSGPLYSSDEGFHETRRHTVIQESFRTLLFLEDERRINGLPERDRSFMFIKIHAVGMQLTDTGTMTKFHFVDCHMPGLALDNKAMEQVIFQGGSLEGATFKGSSFKGCYFTACNISGTNFAFTKLHDQTWLSSHNYKVDRPPIVRPGTSIPTPMRDNGIPMKSDEAIAVLGTANYQADACSNTEEITYIGPAPVDETDTSPPENNV